MAWSPRTSLSTSRYRSARSARNSWSLTMRSSSTPTTVPGSTSTGRPREPRSTSTSGAVLRWGQHRRPRAANTTSSCAGSTRSSRANPSSSRARASCSAVSSTNHRPPPVRSRAKSTTTIDAAPESEAQARNTFTLLALRTQERRISGNLPMLRWLLTFSLRNRLAVVVAAIVLIVAGAYSALRTPLDVFPEFVPPRVEVQVEAPGLSSEAVEQLVTLPLESALNGVPRLTTIRSKSVQGLASVDLFFEYGSDPF